MKIVIAIDSFKGSLTSLLAGSAAAEGCAHQEPAAVGEGAGLQRVCFQIIGGVNGDLSAGAHIHKKNIGTALCRTQETGLVVANSGIDRDAKRTCTQQRRGTDFRQYGCIDTGFLQGVFIKPRFGMMQRIGIPILLFPCHQSYHHRRNGMADIGKIFRAAAIFFIISKLGSLSPVSYIPIVLRETFNFFAN